MGARRIGLAAALAIGCLVLTQGVGCGSSNDGRNGGGGGSGDNGADAGTGGTSGTDGGTGGTGDQADGFSGSSCSATQACQNGYSCADQLPGGYCTKQCTADSDCGTGNICPGAAAGTCSNDSTKSCFQNADCGAAATCQDAQLGTCLKGCDPTVQAGACRTNYVCIAQSANEGGCLPDCRQATGFCEAQNLVCDSTTGSCMLPAGNAGAYQSCATDNCQAGLDALGQANDGSDCVCFPDCSNGTACPGTDVCALQWSGGGQSGNSCLPDCTSGEACPNGWTCQDAGGGKKVCFTPPS